MKNNDKSRNNDILSHNYDEVSKLSEWRLTSRNHEKSHDKSQNNLIIMHDMKYENYESDEMR